MLSLRPVVLAIGVIMTIALPNAASAAPTGAPFEASHTGTAAFTNPATIQSSGSGTARLLGASTSSGLTVIQGPDASCSDGLATTSTETLRAASGDVLVITIHYRACPVSSNVFHSTGHWEVTGGTGRFLGATGQGTSDCNVDFNQSRFAWTLVGRIVLADQDNQ
jgi:hypothetical protein